MLQRQQQQQQKTVHNKCKNSNTLTHWDETSLSCPLVWWGKNWNLDNAGKYIDFLITLAVHQNVY